MADWQSLDPEAAREAEKYDNPIPSRELILQRLADRGEPAAREELAAEFGLHEEDQIEALRRRLRAMERDGQLIYTRRGTYAPVDKLDLICGRVSGHRDGFGFLIPDDGSDDLFLSPSQMRLSSTATAPWHGFPASTAVAAAKACWSKSSPAPMRAWSAVTSKKAASAT